MPSVLGHAAAVLAGGYAFGRRGGRLRFYGLSLLCALVPDLDTIGLRLGIPYEHLFGHRGITHSLLFAVLLGLAVVHFLWREVPRGSARWFALWLWFSLATASHGLVDGLTNGGLGVAYFSPFDTTRYFLPWRPVQVSPIGLGRFLTARGYSVLVSEAVWIGIPSAALAALAWALRRRRAKS